VGGGRERDGRMEKRGGQLSDTLLPKTTPHRGNEITALVRGVEWHHAAPHPCACGVMGRAHTHAPTHKGMAAHDRARRVKDTHLRHKLRSKQTYPPNL
jgi:hypothetical protein